MKRFLSPFILTTLLLLPLLAAAQQAELLDKLPNSRKGFQESEKKVLATIDWIEDTPMDEQQEKRKELNSLLLGWMTKSPTITIEIHSYVLDFTEVNGELLLIFMGGWTRYMLQNNYSNDLLAGNLAGVRSAVKVYRRGELREDTVMDKLVQLDEKQQLEDWIKSKLGL